MTYIVNDPRVFVGVGTGEGDALWKLHRSVALDFELHTIWVELCAAPWVLEVRDFAFVESNHFGADEIAGDVN